MTKKNLDRTAVTTSKGEPRSIPLRGPNGSLALYFLDDSEERDSFEEALEVAAHLGRIAKLMLTAMNLPDTDEEDDWKLLDYVMWASSDYLARAIELHNEQLSPKPAAA